MHECRDVRLLLDDLGSGLAAAMTSLRVDPDHQWILLWEGHWTRIIRIGSVAMKKRMCEKLRKILVDTIQILFQNQH